MKITIKFKLLIQAIIPILFVTLFGAITSLWITVSQHRDMLHERLASNLRHLETELDQMAEEL